MTPDERKKEFVKSGQTIKAWADEHDYPYLAVIMLLNGQHKGRRGQAHDIAVDLGIKSAEQLKHSR